MYLVITVELSITHDFQDAHLLFCFNFTPVMFDSPTPHTHRQYHAT